MCNKEKPCNITISTITIGIIGIVVVIFAICAFSFGYLPNPENDTANTAIILAFVGILATFVVVSNYAQLKDIENKFDKKIKEVQSKIDKNDEVLKETKSMEYREFKRVTWFAVLELALTLIDNNVDISASENLLREKIKDAKRFYGKNKHDFLDDLEALMKDYTVTGGYARMTVLKDEINSPNYEQELEEKRQQNIKELDERNAEMTKRHKEIMQKLIDKMRTESFE